MSNITYTFDIIAEAKGFAKNLLKSGVSFRYENTNNEEVSITLDDYTDEPEIICLCGSTRFAEEFEKQNRRLTLEGKIVLSIGANVSDASLGIAQDSETKNRLDTLHKKKIEMADRVLILNVGGYIGESTRSEIAHARLRRKPIDYLEPLTS